MPLRTHCVRSDVRRHPYKYQTALPKQQFVQPQYWPPSIRRTEKTGIGRLHILSKQRNNLISPVYY